LQHFRSGMEANFTLRMLETRDRRPGVDFNERTPQTTNFIHCAPKKLRRHCTSACTPHVPMQHPCSLGKKSTGPTRTCALRRALDIDPYTGRGRIILALDSMIHSRTCHVAPRPGSGHARFDPRSIAPRTCSVRGGGAPPFRFLPPPPPKCLTPWPWVFSISSSIGPPTAAAPPPPFAAQLPPLPTCRPCRADTRRAARGETAGRGGGNPPPDQSRRRPRLPAGAAPSERAVNPSCRSRVPRRGAARQDKPSGSRFPPGLSLTREQRIRRNHPFTDSPVPSAAARMPCSSANPPRARTDRSLTHSCLCPLLPAATPDQTQLLLLYYRCNC
jgi:hypothetical protein